MSGSGSDLIARIIGQGLGHTVIIENKSGSTGFEAFSSSPEELGAFTEAQLVKWTKMIKDAGIQLE